MNERLATLLAGVLDAGALAQAPAASAEVPVADASSDKPAKAEAIKEEAKEENKMAQKQAAKKAAKKDQEREKK